MQSADGVDPGLADWANRRTAELNELDAYREAVKQETFGWFERVSVILDEYEAGNQKRHSPYDNHSRNKTIPLYEGVDRAITSLQLSDSGLIDGSGKFYTPYKVTLVVTLKRPDDLLPRQEHSLVLDRNLGRPDFQLIDGNLPSYEGLLVLAAALDQAEAAGLE